MCSGHAEIGQRPPPPLPHTKPDLTWGDHPWQQQDTCIISPGNVKAPGYVSQPLRGRKETGPRTLIDTFIPLSCLCDSKLLWKVGALWDHLQGRHVGMQKRAGGWGVEWEEDTSLSLAGRRGSSRRPLTSLSGCLRCNVTAGPWRRCFDAG